jgi:hypothetical protein
VDTGSVVATFTVTLADQTTYPGGVLITLDDSITVALTFTPAGTEIRKEIGKWDIQMTNTLGEKNTYLSGAVFLTKDVSKV